ncbi:MAG: chromate transporter [Rubrivivax sp.]|nr:chromate transporter [Rubrivivax sp.]
MFMAFTRLALQGFGGVLPVAQRELCERQRWLSREEFLEMLSVAQVLPGPNIVNLALMIGDRFFGWRGALMAITGILAAPLLVVLLLAVLAQQTQGVPGIAGALRGMGVAASGLILSTAWRLAGGLRRNALGRPLCVALALATLLAVGVLRWPLAAVVLALGALGMVMAWRRLA